MKNLIRFLTFIILVYVFSPIWGQEGPSIPCVGCNNLTQAPFPETGAWYNPDQSGTGINLEIQNGFLVGYYYGYTIDGFPEWHVITGPLERSDQEGLFWELETNLKYYQGGNCIGCVYQPPMTPTNGPGIKLEFLQRNYLRLTIGESPAQYYIPIIYGSEGIGYFEDQTPYVFPTYRSNGLATHFLFITKPNTDPPSPWLWESMIRPIGEGMVDPYGENESKLVYETWIPQGPPGPDVLAEVIVCELEQTSENPGCKWVWGPKEYMIPIGNMSDSRIFGEAEDGSTIEGYRIGYD